MEDTTIAVDGEETKVEVDATETVEAPAEETAAPEETPAA